MRRKRTAELMVETRAEDGEHQLHIRRAADFYRGIRRR
jgi:hypothetical protein